MSVVVMMSGKVSWLVRTLILNTRLIKKLGYHNFTSIV